MACLPGGRFARHPGASHRAQRPASPGPARARAPRMTVREILAEDLGNPDALTVPPDTPLLGPPLAMTSLTGVELLRRIDDQFGVDIAREDLDLRSLESVGALCEFVASALPRA